MSTFHEKLAETSRKNSSFLCVGLDPDPDLMPIKSVFEFNREIIDATADLVCCYKPNLAFYEALGLDGLEALHRTLERIPDHIPVLGDAKRGDIGPTAQAYAKAMFQQWGFDAVTVSPYLGKDSVEPFLEYADRGVFILCHTSNPGAEDLQDLTVGQGKDQTTLYEHVARSAQEWNIRGNVGLVVGATYPQQLQTVRDLCPDMPILIPGIGTQGGDLEASIKNGVNSKGEGIIINASRSIIYASRNSNSFVGEARRAAQELRQQINSAREQLR